MNLFDTNLKKIWYNIEGNGDKYLVLIHGLGQSSDVFIPHLKYFRDSYKIILPDLPGHGRSSRLKEFPIDYYAQCAEIIINLLKKLNVKKADLIGIRAGSIIAMNMGVMAPKLVNHIVADSFPGIKISNGNLDLIIDDLERRKKNFLKRWEWQKLHGADWKDIIEAKSAFMEKMKFTDHRKVVPNISNIENEVLLIGSARDDLVPPLSPIYRKLKKKYPHFNIFLFESGKNPAMFSNKKKFHVIVSQFLSNPVKQ
jgi:pimeloyl-ACP methyl ester carboxylesterase